MGVIMRPRFLPLYLAGATAKPYSKIRNQNNP